MVISKHEKFLGIDIYNVGEVAHRNFCDRRTDRMKKIISLPEDWKHTKTRGSMG